MITELKTNLLTYPLQAIVHQANCYHTFGAGIALQIKKIYPEAYEVDKTTKCGDRLKLGTFSIAHCLKEDKYIYNMYSQYDFGYIERMTSYDAMYDGLSKIKADILHKHLSTIGLPKYIGCGLGGGNWNIVNTIINEVFKDTKTIDVYICYL